MVSERIFSCGPLAAHVHHQPPAHLARQDVAAGRVNRFEADPARYWSGVSPDRSPRLPLTARSTVSSRRSPSMRMAEPGKWYKAW